MRSAFSVTNAVAAWWGGGMENALRTRTRTHTHTHTKKRNSPDPVNLTRGANHFQ